MSKFENLTDPCLKVKQINEFHKSKKTSLNQLNIPTCEQSRSAMIDVIILIIVIGAFEFLQYPYFKALVHNTVEIGREVVDVIREEIVLAPVVFGCLGLSILFATIALVAIKVCTYRKFGKPGCRGLQKAAEFDIQLETKECVKRSTFVAKNGLKKGIFQLPRDHHRELKVELKKMVPPNGRVVLVFEQDVDALLTDWNFIARYETLFVISFSFIYFCLFKDDGKFVKICQYGHDLQLNEMLEMSGAIKIG
ncbi:uncharacterized protein Fot_05089 [Forsythia ovata]|uniref:Uncharacterized protein n=1 Tax=Forsythia ovata TaxID=205694 RepID=A0ABD1WPS4_9LAMI